LLGQLQGFNQIVGAAFAHAIEAAQECCIESIQIRNRTHQALVDELFDQLAAEAVHIQALLCLPSGAGHRRKIAGQLLLTQHVAASSSSRTRSDPHSGQCSGSCTGVALLGRSSGSTRTTSGIISPALRTTMVSPR
jgi:hypothetical protein